MSEDEQRLRWLAANPTTEDIIKGSRETREKLDHTLQAYGRLERKHGDLKRERNEYRQAALELNAEIRCAMAWMATGAEPSVAHNMLLKTADKWRALLEDGRACA